METPDSEYEAALGILQGHVKSMEAVAECYGLGRGTFRSPQKAAQWKERAAELRNKKQRRQ